MDDSSDPFDRSVGGPIARPMKGRRARKPRGSGARVDMPVSRPDSWIARLGRPRTETPGSLAPILRDGLAGNVHGTPEALPSTRDAPGGVVHPIAPRPPCTSIACPSRRLQRELVLGQRAASSFEASRAEDGTARWAGQLLRRHG